MDATGTNEQPQHSETYSVRTSQQPIQPPTLQQLVTLRSNLLDAAYSAYPELLVWDANAIVDSITGKMAEHGGSTDGFEEWATENVTAQATRLRDYVSLSGPGTPGRKAIAAAVIRSLPTDINDCSVYVEDIVDEVCAKLVYPNVESLSTHGQATITTRLYAMAKRHTMGYYTIPMRRRCKSLQTALQSGRRIACEFLSEAEQAELQKLEMEDVA